MANIQSNKKRVLLLVETSRAFGREVICGISRYILSHNEWTVFFEDRGLLERLPLWINNWHGDGIIARSVDARVHNLLQAKGIPMVELLGDGKTVFPDVTCNDQIVGEMAAKHFHERGFLNYAFFSSENCYWAVRRRQAFEETVREYGCHCHVFPSAKKVSKGYASPELLKKPIQIITQWLRQLPKPVGLFAATDMYAVYVLEACQEAGFRVPEDVAVLGADNDVLLCSITTPKLSSINLNGYQIGYQASVILDQKMSGKKIESPMVLLPPGRIIERQSSDHYTIEDPDVLAALIYIRENAASNISVVNVADYTALSRRTLERRFLTLLHRTPNDEIVRVRLQLAVSLLLETEFSVTSISNKTGFSSPEYFIRVFRRVYRMTPNQFRLISRNKIHHDWSQE